jgi:autotransporter-associated beta strand protein
MTEQMKTPSTNPHQGLICENYPLYITPLFTRFDPVKITIMKPNHKLRTFLLGSSLLAIATTAHAQTWDGSSNASWNTAANWNTPASVPGANANVIFNGSGINLNTTTNKNFSLASLTFTSGQTSAVTINTTAGANDLTLAGGTSLTVDAGNHIVIGTGTSSSLTSRDWNVADAATTFAVNGTSSFEINGRVGGSAINKAMTKTGTGTLILSGNNGSSGAWQFSTLTVNAGVVRFAETNATGNSRNNFSVTSGAAFEISNNATLNVGNTASGNITLNGTGIGGTGALRSISGNNRISSSVAAATINLNTATSIGVDADTLTIAKVISGGASNTLTKVGAGTLELTAINTYSGATTVNLGTLLVNGSITSAVTVNNNSAFGGTGTVESLSMNSGSLFHVENLFDSLAVNGAISIFAGFGINDLTGIDWGTIDLGTYTLIDGSLDTGIFAGLSNNSFASSYDIGNNKTAYFQEGSLQLVVATAIPEPSTALLSGLGLLTLIIRRKR